MSFQTHKKMDEDATLPLPFPKEAKKIFNLLAFDFSRDEWSAKNVQLPMDRAVYILHRRKENAIGNIELEED